MKMKTSFLLHPRSVFFHLRNCIFNLSTFNLCFVTSLSLLNFLDILNTIIITILMFFPVHSNICVSLGKL